jgi:hypothetical protein
VTATGARVCASSDDALVISSSALVKAAVAVVVAVAAAVADAVAVVVPACRAVAALHSASTAACKDSICAKCNSANSIAKQSISTTTSIQCVRRMKR